MILLDLRAAFDTVDDDIPLERLQMSFDINVAVHWFHSAAESRLRCQVNVIIAFVFVVPQGVSIRTDTVHDVGLHCRLDLGD